MTTESKPKSWGAALVGFLLGAVLLLMGSAVDQPPVSARGFDFNSLTTTPIASGADTSFNLDVGQGATKSLLIANDNAATTDSDLLVSLNSATAPAPSSTAASTTFRMRPGNMINLDGKWGRCTMRGATGTVTARVIATY